jgi:hypothetical protein
LSGEFNRFECGEASFVVSINKDPDSPPFFAALKTNKVELFRIYEINTVARLEKILFDIYEKSEELNRRKTVFQNQELGKKHLITLNNKMVSSLVNSLVNK